MLILFILLIFLIIIFLFLLYTILKPRIVQELAPKEHFDKSIDYSKQHFLYPKVKKDWTISSYMLLKKLKEYPYITYDSAYIAKPKNVYFPKSKEDIQNIIIGNKGRKIRVSGGHHTFNGISISDDIMIRTYNLKKILDLDRVNKTVKVESGILLEELNLYLEKHNLALHVLPAIAYQCIAGVLSTGSHGSRYDSSEGSMSSAILEMTMVLPDGSIKTIRRGNLGNLGYIGNLGDPGDPDFKAFNTCLGALGVIYSVKLQCVDLFVIKHTNVKVNIDDFINNLNSYKSKYLFMQAYYYPFKKNKNKNTTLYLREKITDFDPEEIVKQRQDGSIRGVKERTDFSHRILTKSLEASYYTEIEVGIPVQHLETALEDIVKLHKDYKNKHNYTSKYPILIRFTGADTESFMAMSAGRVGQNTVFFDIFNRADLAKDKTLYLV